jgi:hypothetical protein
VSWFGLLVLALVLLWDRYDWSDQARPFSWRGYLSSAYLLVFTLPTLYYLLRELSGGARLASVVTAATASVLTLPYRWLGLNRWYREPPRPPQWFTPNEQVEQAMGRWWSMPYEVPFFTGLVALGVAVASIYLWRCKRAHLGGARPWSKAALWLGLYGLVLVQTWLHLGIRSPLCYLAYRPYLGIAVDEWYVVCLFPPDKGVVCSDYCMWHDLEDHFIGYPREIPTELIRRSYLFYLSSQLSYFINPYYVFLVLNIGLWVLACFCAYRLASWWWNGEVGAYCALLVATGTGFIVMVAHVESYQAAYALYIALPCLYERFFVRDDKAGWGRWLLFGSILGLCSLVYDLFPLYVFFLGYACLRRLALQRVGVSLVLALAVYAGFLALQQHIPGLEPNPSESAGQITGAISTAFQVVKECNLGRLYELSLVAFKSFIEFLLYDFFLLPVLLAIGGAVVLHSRFLGAALSLLALPAFLVVTAFTFGQSVLLANPRHLYIAYPTIYMLTAVLLARLRAALARGPFGPLASLPVGLTLSAIFTLSNSDMISSPFRRPPPQTYWYFLLEGKPAAPYAEVPLVTHMTDAGLRELKDLENLASLDLSGSKVTDAGLRALVHSKHLQALTLSKTAVTLAGVSQLTELKQLQTLDLGNTSVGDTGINALASLRQLKWLSLGYTRVSDAGLKGLAQLEQLEWLDLGHTRVSDAGLKELIALKQLQTLDLYDNRITDAGLMELTALKQLQVLNVAGTMVSADGVKAFQQVLPQCQVQR